MEYDDILTGFAIDNGGSFMKVSFTGDDMPRSYFPTVAGRRKHKSLLLQEGESENDIFVGDTAMSRRGILNLSWPLQRGLINDFELMTRIWHRAFYDELKLGVYESPTIMTEHPLAPSAQREKITEIMFENFDSPAFFMNDTASFISYTTGLMSGVVVESGGGTTTVVPYYKNQIIKSAIMSIDLGGDDLSEFFVKSLTAKGVEVTTMVDKDILSYSKEKHCYVALDPTKEQTEFADITMGSGDTIRVTDELHTIPEAIFQPPLLGIECAGIHELIYSAIKKTDPAIQAELWQRIVLAGGNTLFKGFEERLQKELTALAPPDTQIKILAKPERKYTAFAGASMLATLSGFQQYWITKEDYDENGPGITEMRQKTFSLNQKF